MADTSINLAQEMSEILSPYFHQVETIAKDLREISASLNVLKTELGHRSEGLATVINAVGILEARVAAVEVRLAVVDQQLKEEGVTSARLRNSISTVVMGILMLLIGAIVTGLWKSH